MKSWDTRFFKYDFVWSSAFYHLCTTLVGHARNVSTFKFPLCQDHPSLCHPGMFSKTTPNLLSSSSFLWDVVQAVRTRVLNFPHQATFPPAPRSSVLTCTIELWESTTITLTLPHGCTVPKCDPATCVHPRYKNYVTWFEVSNASTNPKNNTLLWDTSIEWQNKRMMDENTNCWMEGKR